MPCIFYLFCLFQVIPLLPFLKKEKESSILTVLYCIVLYVQITDNLLTSHILVNIWYQDQNFSVRLGLLIVFLYTITVLQKYCICTFVSEYNIFTCVLFNLHTSYYSHQKVFIFPSKLLYDIIFYQILGCIFKIHTDNWQQPAFIFGATTGQ